MTNTIVEVSDCLRLDTGNVSVLGTVTSLSRLYKMLKSVNYYCSDCGFSDTELFDPVVDISDSNLKPIIKSSKKCKCEILIRPTFDYVNAVTIELQDSDDLKETEKLLCILFEENTRDIRVGEKVMISGNVQVIIKNKKAVTCLYSTAIKYENKKDIQVTELDKKAIQRFVDKKKENTIDELVKMFAVNTIGYNIVKKGLLLSAVSSGIDKKYENGLGNRERIHVIIVGDPGIGKSNLLRESIKLVPNSRYESGQHSSGKSLTAIVTKENEEYFLRYGSISLSNGAICALNEIGRMNFEDQGFLLDVMEEGSFTINKYGINARIKSSTVIVATSNPLGSTWNKNTGFDSNGYDDDNGKIDLSKIPLLNPVLDRFDLVFVVQTIKDEQEYRKYAQIKTIQVSDPKLIPTYYPYLKKHIQYAKSFSPSLTEEASTLIREYYINLAKSSSNHFGSSKRTLEKLIRISKSIAKIKLKNKVDVDDAKEALEFFNAVILQYESAVIAIPPNPSDLTLSMFVDLLKESSFPHTLEELARKACEKNEFIRSYLASDDKHTSNKNKFQISNNKKLRNIYNILADNPSIQVLSAKPIVLRWKPLHLNYRANLSDSSDLYDPNSVISTNSEDNEEMNRRDDDKDNSTIDVKSTYIFQDKKNLRSDESYRSDS
ncbi:MAG: AAA family ATPase, partial [Candidatus Nitrosocosmicus sp.]|nr:AAA family ATPase [Candidatus Nitrosocosmicus sp.]